eukprot:MONOS_4048.2-p1 / transcript=MONOS_4048.2 / gene=MONOS_4048 / organism=Monocercomonoides_exilis_PA203 / gene_product=BRCA1 associated protein / transcript_product=BRCA1 associated protein / location=Mono_scaffold00103:7568-10031(+) / protein_length=539 / sequence_SO=supercontig / SO=protein_coding / is_pseudo=false
MHCIRQSKNRDKYLAIIKMDSSESAESLYLEYNGRPFSALEAFYCHIVFVASLEVVDFNMEYNRFRSPHPLFGSSLHSLSYSSSSSSSSFTSPLTTSSISSASPSCQSGRPLSPAVHPSPSPPNSAKPSPSPSPSLIEMPTCPVCLERLDARECGILTIMCNHSFHMQCFSQWSQGSCPVCRYSLGPQPPESECAVCGTHEALWICLICGHIGCGRYHRGHAARHFEETQHNYALELETQRVWDYTQEGYVHRLVQNQSDGKLVEIDRSTEKRISVRRPMRRRIQHGSSSGEDGSKRGGGGGGGGTGAGREEEEGEHDSGSEDDWASLHDVGESFGCVCGAEEMFEEKIQEIVKEYGRLLLNQLDEQLRFYEEKLARSDAMTREVQQMASREQNAAAVAKKKQDAQIMALKRELSRRDEDIHRLSIELEVSAKEKKKLESRISDLLQIKDKHTEERKTLEAITHTQQKMIEQQKAHITSLTAQIAIINREHQREVDDLQAQVQDLVSNLELQSKMMEGTDATISVPSSSSHSKKKKSKR